MWTSEYGSLLEFLLFSPLGIHMGVGLLGHMELYIVFSIGETIWFIYRIEKGGAIMQIIHVIFRWYRTGQGQEYLGEKNPWGMTLSHPIDTLWLFRETDLIGKIKKKKALKVNKKRKLKNTSTGYFRQLSVIDVTAVYELHRMDGRGPSTRAITCCPSGCILIETWIADGVASLWYEMWAPQMAT